MNPVSMGAKDVPTAEPGDAVNDALLGCPQVTNFASQTWKPAKGETTNGFVPVDVPEEPLFQVVGGNFQVVNIPLQPDQEIIASPVSWLSRHARLI